jgi:PAS domain S-box-containing protein
MERKESGDGSKNNRQLHASEIQEERDHLLAMDEPAPADMAAALRELRREIADRRRAEAELLEREARLTSIFRAAPVGIGLVVDRIIMDANERLCEMLGCEPEYLLGESARILYDSDQDFEYVGREKYAQISVQGTGTVETRWKRKDDRIIDVLLSSTPLDVTDWSAGVTFTALDITERKVAEEERLNLERKLLHAQKLESLGVLAGGIAHDFNNLLMVILGNLDLALQDLSPVSAARMGIENAIQATRRATDLTRQMLAYSGKGRFMVSRVDLNDLVRENADLFRTAVSRMVTIQLCLNTERSIIEADPGQIQQVIMNLLTNASEAVGEQAGEITLSTGMTECDEVQLSRSRVEERPEPGRFAFVEVTDTGSGMDAGTQERLFDPFFTTKFTGRGLGMSAVLGIVRGHKGAILVESERERGTTIRVLFPACGVAETVKERAVRMPPAEAPSDVSCRTILVVDDEEEVRRLALAFIQYLGHKGMVASDGEEALKLFEQSSGEIDCVLLDLTMPRMDGLSAFRRLRAIRPDIRVILSSGYNEQDATQRFMGEGLTGFIQKPYRLHQLRELLNRTVEDLV